MKNTKQIIVALLFIVLTQGSFSAFAESTNKIILTTQNWPPYQVEQSNTLSGLAVDVVRCAMDKMNQGYEIQVYPWKRAQHMVEYGRAQGFFSASKNEKRDEYALFSTPIADQKWNWYLLRESTWTPEDPKFKKEVTVSAQTGSNMAVWLEKNGYSLRSNPKTTKALFKMLHIHRYEAILASEWVANEVIADLGKKTSDYRIFTCRDKPLGVYFSKEFIKHNPEFLYKFNAYVQECKHTGKSS